MGSSYTHWGVVRRDAEIPFHTTQLFIECVTPAQNVLKYSICSSISHNPLQLGWCQVAGLDQWTVNRSDTWVFCTKAFKSWCALFSSLLPSDPGSHISMWLWYKLMGAGIPGYRMENRLICLPHTLSDTTAAKHSGCAKLLRFKIRLFLQHNLECPNQYNCIVLRNMGNNKTHMGHYPCH